MQKIYENIFKSFEVIQNINKHFYFGNAWIIEFKPSIDFLWFQNTWWFFEDFWFLLTFIQNKIFLVGALCVCVFILFHLLVSSGYTTSVTYVRSSDQWSFVVSISRGFYQVPSSLFLNLSYFKLQPTAYWREKRYDLMFALEKMIYIDIGYKSAHYKNRQWWKDTKDKEATLI